MPPAPHVAQPAVGSAPAGADDLGAALAQLQDTHPCLADMLGAHRVAPRSEGLGKDDYRAFDNSREGKKAHADVAYALRNNRGFEGILVRASACQPPRQLVLACLFARPAASQSTAHPRHEPSIQCARSLTGLYVAHVHGRSCTA